MKRVTKMVVWTLLAAAMGCSANDPKSKMQRAVREYSDGADIIATIKDQQTFEAAKPRLKNHLAWVREQNRENQAKSQAYSGKGSDKGFDKAMGEFDKLSKEPEFQQMMEAISRYTGEMMRASLAVPAFSAWYQKETKP